MREHFSDLAGVIPQARVAIFLLGLYEGANLLKEQFKRVCSNPLHLKFWKRAGVRYSWLGLRQTLFRGGMGQDSGYPNCPQAVLACDADQSSPEIGYHLPLYLASKMPLTCSFLVHLSTFLSGQALHDRPGLRGQIIRSGSSFTSSSGTSCSS